MAALQDKTLSDGSPPLSFQKSTIAGPAPIDWLLWTTAKSAYLGLWSSKIDMETWTSLEPGMVNVRISALEHAGIPLVHSCTSITIL